MVDERDFEAEQPIIQLKHASLQYPGSSNPSVADIDLSLYEREFVCVLGPSGCGKSTLLKMLAGFERPTEGSAVFCGEPIQSPDWRRGVVFQQPPLYPWLTVEENVAFGPKMQGIGKRERSELAKKYLAQVGLKDFCDHKPYELSGGMRQRAAIARALINQPKLLLMDEPFGALDALTREQMQQLVRNIWSETKCTFFFITHDVDEALSLGTRVLVMSARPGRVLKEFPVTFTYGITGEKNDRTRYTQDFISLREELLGLISSTQENYSI